MACCEATEDVEDKTPSAMEPKEDDEALAARRSYLIQVLIGVLLIVLTGKTPMYRARISK